MTMHLLDVASYQGGLSASAVKLAGFGAVNLKISHGLGRKAVHPDLAGWVERARTLGLGICTFHYMTAEVSGIDQAEYAYEQMVRLGIQTGTAHQLDVESSPAPGLSSVRAYLARMTELLDRPVALYTGDWWWAPKRWDVSDLTPYLWSAPNDGYLRQYPGDTARDWAAGYGGWPHLAVMQYAVGPLPGGNIDVSKSAIRDESVWRDLTLGRPGMSYPPDTLKAARSFYMATLRLGGYTLRDDEVGIVGDDSHAKSGTSYHLGKDALRSDAYSIIESIRDSRGLTNAAMAIDFGEFTITVKGKRHNLISFSLWLVAQCKAGAADTLDIREIIYSPDGATVKRWDRLGKRTTGDISHTGHTHVSYFRDSEGRDKTALLRRYFTEIGLLEDPMATLDADDKTWLSNNLPNILWGAQLGTAGSAGGAVQTLVARSSELRVSTMPAIAQTLTAILKNVTDDDAVVAQVTGQILAAVGDASTETADAVLERLGGAGQSDTEIASALRAALGQRASAVGALLAG